MNDKAKAELAPTGVLRAGINLSNFLLVTGRSATGDPEGVAPDMARAIAAELGVPVKYVPFKTPGDLMEKTRQIARQKGSNMLAQIVAALQDGHNFPGAPDITQPVRFGMLIGHDTNILNVAGLLNLGWKLAGFQENTAPPGSALAFELLKEVRTGQQFVRLAYFAQTPEQMRQATRLDLNHLPDMVAVPLAACGGQETNNACPLQRFVEIAKAAIDPGCVTIGKLR